MRREGRRCRVRRHNAMVSEDPVPVEGEPRLLASMRGRVEHLVVAASKHASEAHVRPAHVSVYPTQRAERRHGRQRRGMAARVGRETAASLQWPHEAFDKLAAQPVLTGWVALRCSQ